MTDKELLLKAIEARKSSYSPYSDFQVGAALMTKEGKVYLGANIENAAYTPTICAERVAFFKAINNGERNFEKIAIIGGKAGEPPVFCAPCGVCRQVMAEFCKEDFRIVLGTPDGEIKVYTLATILPDYFGPKDLD